VEGAFSQSNSQLDTEIYFDQEKLRHHLAAATPKLNDFADA
jgi:hypothetical protein